MSYQSLCQRYGKAKMKALAVLSPPTLNLLIQSYMDQDCYQMAATSIFSLIQGRIGFHFAYVAEERLRKNLKIQGIDSLTGTQAIAKRQSLAFGTVVCLGLLFNTLAFENTTAENKHPEQPKVEHLSQSSLSDNVETDQSLQHALVRVFE